MKRQILITAVLLLMATGIKAQQWSSPLYWVVETNTFYRGYSIVRFYDHKNILVHEVKIHGVNIDIRIPKHKRKLDELLKGYTERQVTASKRKSKRLL